MALRRFEGKSVIVTGSSNGIGRETAVLFAEEGAQVTICGRNAKSLQETKNIILKQGGSEKDIVEVVGDLSQDETAKLIIDKTIAKFEKIDVLVNNAAGTAPDNTTARGFSQGMDVYDYVMTVNLRSVVTLTRLAMPHLIKSQGEVVMISSITGLNFAFPAFPYYGMSKAAVNQLTRALAAEFGPKGVRINAVNPGIITTTIMKKQGASDSEQEEMENKLCSSALQCPLQRPGTSREIAEAVAFLSDRKRSSYIVGHCMVVDGGSAVHMPVLANWNTNAKL